MLSQIFARRLLPPANVVCEGYIFTGVCDSVNRGGVHGFIWGVCVVLFGGVCGFIGGHVWFYSGGVHGFIRGRVWFYPRGHAWFYLGDMRGFIRGACMVLFGGCAWFYSGSVHGFIWGACVVFPVFSDTMRYGQWAGGMHPTGMHSCWS